jgi:cytochrome c oxidase assembly protein subunit 15
MVAWLLVLVTFGLVALGGHVTSKDAGMAVPDGFTTFGYWSLTAPLYSWWYDEGTRLEHGHRLMGYVVGSATLLVVAAFWATQRSRRWVKWLSVLLLVFVIGQGIMGILRVDEVSTFLAGVHGVTGQIFLGLTVLAAAAVGRRWMSRTRADDAPPKRRRVRPLPWIMLGLLLLQLVLGSAVRHSGSALAIPDWPKHYGQVVPPMSQEKLDAAVAAYPADRLPERYGVAVTGQSAEPYAVGQVHLHFTHRVGGYLTFAFGLFFVASIWRRHGGRDSVLAPAAVLGILLCMQVALGVMTIWSGENAILATSHQTFGAALLATATWLTIRLHLLPRPSDRPADVPVASGDAMAHRHGSAAAPNFAAAEAGPA